MSYVMATNSWDWFKKTSLILLKKCYSTRLIILTDLSKLQNEVLSELFKAC
jgi:hypothetical protein